MTKKKKKEKRNGKKTGLFYVQIDITLRESRIPELLTRTNRLDGTGMIVAEKQNVERTCA